jgi:hypothetical protein
VQYLVNHFELLIALALIVFAVAQMRSDVDRSAKLFLLTVFGAPLMLPAQYIALQLNKLCPVKYDLYIYKVDGIFGQPSFALGHLHHAPLIVVTYNSLGMVIICACAVYMWQRPNETATVLKTFALNLFLALPIYLLIPVCGPNYAFRGFPALPGPIAAHPVTISAAPNGIPSVHTSTALLILWFLRHWPLGRAFGAVFLALTVLATLGSGEHYFFDLLCAVPYAAGVCWLGAKPKVVSSRSYDDLESTRAGVPVYVGDGDREAEGSRSRQSA